MGILLAGRKLHVDPKWTSRFISGGTIGSVALPALVGVALAENSDALPVAEAVFVGLVSLACEPWPSCAESHSLTFPLTLQIIVSYIVVAVMPDYDERRNESDDQIPDTKGCAAGVSQHTEKGWRSSAVDSAVEVRYNSSRDHHGTTEECAPSTVMLGAALPSDSVSVTYSLALSEEEAASAVVQL